MSRAEQSRPAESARAAREGEFANSEPMVSATVRTEVHERSAWLRSAIVDRMAEIGSELATATRKARAMGSQLLSIYSLSATRNVAPVRTPFGVVPANPSGPCDHCTDRDIKHALIIEPRPNVLLIVGLCSECLAKECR